MKAGALRQRVRVEQITDDSQDSAGQPIKSWQTFAERKASIEPIDPMRTPIFRAGERFEPGTARIEMRYTPGIVNTMRVIDEATGIVYEIIDAADEKTRHRKTVLICRTGINDNG